MVGSSRWIVHGERTAYDSPWLQVSLLDVEPPGGTRYEHHVVRATAAAAGCLVLSDDGAEPAVLLIWRHRVITDRWGWELPAGRVEAGETPLAAAVRETHEETGWRVRDPQHVLEFHPIGGTGDLAFHVVTAIAQALDGPGDPHEAERVAWFVPTELRRLVREGQIREGLALVGVLTLLSGLAWPVAGSR
jgi:8-oxo-dGTP pyrophosphatase MutT (NUDIX family)